MFSVKEHLVADSEAEVPAVSVELCLAPVLPLLQQRPDLACHLAQQACSSLAVARRRRRVGWCCQEQGAAGVLAAVGVEGRVARSER